MSAPLASITIHDLAFGGKGVGRLPDGRAVFVPRVIPGEEVRVRITREQKRMAEAELVEVVRPSPHRIEPPCPYFARCGGCAYQHLTDAQQLVLKTQQVEQTIRRLGGCASVPIQPAVASPATYGYRNRLRVHGHEGRLGFYARRGHDLVEIDHCPLAEPAVNEALQRLRRTLPRDFSGDRTVSARPLPFFEQTNDGVAALLLARVREELPHDCSRLVDAYCGAGFFAQALADRFDEVIGIEANAAAIQEARRRAAPHARYLVADVAQALGHVLAEGGAEKIAQTVVLLDPPAAGLAPRVIDHLLGFRPPHVLYVSCDPATLARDLRRLAPGYRLRTVIPFDMFPQTSEIEVLTCLEATPS